MLHFRVREFFVLSGSPKIQDCCSSPICSSVSRAHSCAFLLSDFCSCIILSSKDHPYSLRQHGCLVLKSFVLTLDSLRQHCCLCFLLFQEGLHSWDMCHSFGTCLPFFPQEQVCSSTYSCSRGMNLWQTFSGGRIRPFIWSGL